MSTVKQASGLFVKKTVYDPVITFVRYLVKWDQSYTPIKISK